MEHTEPDYFVENMHNVRIRRKELEYLVEWQGLLYHEEHHTWEPANHLPNDQEIIAHLKERGLKQGIGGPKLDIKACGHTGRTVLFSLIFSAIDKYSVCIV